MSTLGPRISGVRYRGQVGFRSAVIALSGSGPLVSALDRAISGVISNCMNPQTSGLRYRGQLKYRTWLFALSGGPLASAMAWTASDVGDHFRGLKRQTSASTTEQTVRASRHLKQAGEIVCMLRQEVVRLAATNQCAIRERCKPRAGRMFLGSRSVE